MEWEKVVEREGDFLKNYLLYESYAHNFPSVHDGQQASFLTTRNGNTFTHFIHKPSAKTFSRYLHQKLAEDPAALGALHDQGKSHFENLLHFSQELNQQELARLSNSELRKLTDRYFAFYRAPYPYFNATLFTDALEGNAEAVRTFADLRLSGRLAFNRAHALSAPLFEEIGKRFGVSADEIKFLKPAELLSLLNGESLEIRARIRNRQQCYFLLENGTFTLRENAHYAMREEPSGTLTGRGTFPTRYVGRVKVILVAEDLGKIAPGDIAVLKTVPPDLAVAGIAHAGAIIAEEGGLTCHAAVLSREWNLPAVLGVKNATALLRDGDHIEMDTENGSIKKVETDFTLP